MTTTERIAEIEKEAADLRKRQEALDAKIAALSGPEPEGVPWPDADLVQGTVLFDDGGEITALWQHLGDGIYDSATCVDYARENGPELPRFLTATPMIAVPKAEWDALIEADGRSIDRIADAAWDLIAAHRALEAQK